MSAETPQPQDRVRWTRQIAIEGVVEEVTDDGYHIRDRDGRVHLCQRVDATVEVLERAATDLTYRVGNHNPRNIYLGDEHVGVMFDPEAGPVVVAALNAAVAERRQEQPVPEWELAPGPRPAVWVPNEPHGIPNKERERVAVRLVAGDMASAVRVLTALGMTDMNALSYVRAMPEYQTYLEQHGGDEHASAPRYFVDDTSTRQWKANPDGHVFFRDHGEGSNWQPASTDLPSLEKAPAVREVWL